MQTKFSRKRILLWLLHPNSSNSISASFASNQINLSYVMLLLIYTNQPTNQATDQTEQLEELFQRPSICSFIHLFIHNKSSSLTIASTMDAYFLAQSVAIFTKQQSNSIYNNSQKSQLAFFCSLTCWLLLRIGNNEELRFQTLSLIQFSDSCYKMYNLILPSNTI